MPQSTTIATPGPKRLQDHIFLFLLFDDVILFSSEIDLSLMALFTYLLSPFPHSLCARVRMENSGLHSLIIKSVDFRAVLNREHLVFSKLFE